jgi:hypothetical protein
MPKDRIAILPNRNSRTKSKPKLCQTKNLVIITYRWNASPNQNLLYVVVTPLNINYQT